VGAGAADVKHGIAPHVVHRAVLAASAGWQAGRGQGKLHCAWANRRRRGGLVLTGTSSSTKQQTDRRHMTSTVATSSRRRTTHGSLHWVSSERRNILHELLPRSI
jgi:hypothetical protein